MTYVEIKFKNFSFEENPALVTWLQKFLVKVLEDDVDRPGWTSFLIDEWKLNIEIEIYKYFFDDELLDDSDKLLWAKKFIDLALVRINNMQLKEFADFIEMHIDPQVDFERIKKILRNIGLMLDEKSPIETH